MSKAELKCVIFVEGEDDVMTWEYNDIRKFFIQRLKSNDINHFHVSSRKEGSFYTEVKVKRHQSFSCVIKKRR